MNNNSFESLAELQAREAANFDKLKERVPEKFERSQSNDPNQVLARIGITNLPDRPNGYLRYNPQDFVVEEVDTNQSVITVEPGSQPENLEPEALTIYAKLVKAGIGTPEATHQIANQLGVKPQKVAHAGIKDARAITAQRISIRESSIDQVQNISSNNFFVEIIHTGKGALNVGELYGNRFTIVIRTEQPIESSNFQQQTEQLQANGFANFFGVQRFGTRLSNPYFGLLLARGDFAGAIKSYLTQSGPFDIPIYVHIRNKAAEHYPNWPNMYKAFDILPYRFRHERQILKWLIKHPDDWLGTLINLQDQVRFWVYGYSNFMINQFLSQGIAGQVDIPDPLPIPFCGPLADDLYQPFLQRDNTLDHSHYLPQLPFLKFTHRTLDPWIMPTIHTTKVIEAGVIISFTLPKGVYATTFLMHLFNLYEGIPTPGWVNDSLIDPKVELGSGNVEQAVSHMNFVDRAAEYRAEQAKLASETDKEKDRP